MLSSFIRMRCMHCQWPERIRAMILLKTQMNVYTPNFKLIGGTVQEKIRDIEHSIVEYR